MLQSGASLEEKDAKGLTPACHAAAKGQTQVWGGGGCPIDMTLALPCDVLWGWDGVLYETPPLYTLSPLSLSLHLSPVFLPTVSTYPIVGAH